MPALSRAAWRNRTTRIETGPRIEAGARMDSAPTPGRGCARTMHSWRSSRYTRWSAQPMISSPRTGTPARCWVHEASTRKVPEPAAHDPQFCARTPKKRADAGQEVDAADDADPDQGHTYNASQCFTHLRVARPADGRRFRVVPSARRALARCAPKSLDLPNPSARCRSHAPLEHEALVRLAELLERPPVRRLFGAEARKVRYREAGAASASG